MLEIFIVGELRLCRVCGHAYQVTRAEREAEDAMPGVRAVHDTCAQVLINRYLTPTPLKLTGAAQIHLRKFSQSKIYKR